jgi:hypothetical protein
MPIVRLEPDGLIVVSYCQIVVALGLVGERAAGVSLGIVRLELDGLGLVRYFPVVVTLITVRDAAIIVSLRIVGGNLDRFIEVRYRLIVFPCVAVSDTTVKIRLCPEALFDCDCCAEVRYRISVIALVFKCVTARDECAGEIVPTSTILPR